MENHALSAGSLLKERYSIHSVLAQRGPVVEYLARDEATGARCAVRQVRFLRQDVAASRAYRRSFRQQAPGLLALHHPGLARVIDCFDEGPDYFVVAVWVDGESLAALGVPVSEEVAVRWMYQVLDALDALAQAGVGVEMDGIDPSRLRVRDNGSIVLGGLHLPDPEPALRDGGPFCPPELQPSMRSHLYSLGAVAYWLLCGSSPAASRDRPSRLDALELPSSAPPAVVRTIRCMMAVDARNRPATPDAARRMLARAGVGPPASTRRPSRRKSFERWSRAAAILALLGTIGGLGALGSREVHSMGLARTERQARSIVALARVEYGHGRWSDCIVRLQAARSLSGDLDRDDTLLLASALEAALRPRAAVSALRHLLAHDPGDGGAYLLLARAYRDSHQPSPARAAYEKSGLALNDRLASHPADADTLWRMGQWCMDRHLTVEAIDRLSRAVAMQPSLLAARVDLGSALRQAGHLLESEKVLRSALDEDRTNAAACKQMGLTLQLLGRHQQAADVFQQALDSSGGDPELLVPTAASLLRLGRRPEAELALQEALRQDPARVDARLELAVCHLAAGRIGPARQMLEEAAALLAGPGDQPETCVSWGRAQAGLGHPDDARAAYERAHVLDPAAAEPLWRMAALLPPGDAAAAAFQQARQTGPEGCAVVGEQARFLIGAGRPEEAVDVLEAPLQATPQEPSLELLMGQALLQLKRYAEASRILARATLDHSGCSLGYDLLAQCECALKQDELAALHFEKLGLLDPHQARAWLASASLWLQAHAPEKALHCCKEGLRYNSAEPGFRFWLGAVHETLKQQGVAVKDYKTYLKLDPRGPWAAPAMRRLEALTKG